MLIFCRLADDDVALVVLLNHLFSEAPIAVKPPETHPTRGSCYVLFQGFKRDAYERAGVGGLLKTVLGREEGGRAWWEGPF